MNKTNTASRAAIAFAVLMTATIGMMPTAAADDQPWWPLGYPYCDPVEIATEFPFVWILEDCILPPPFPPEDPEPEPEPEPDP